MTRRILPSVSLLLADSENNMNPIKSIFHIYIILLAGMMLYGCDTHLNTTYISENSFISFSNGKSRYRLPVRTWVDFRDQYVVIQQFDYSCGAAALATLMRYYFDDDVSEEEILLTILNSLTNEEIRDREKFGLSLLDLQHCARRKGYQAVAVKLAYNNIQLLQGPILIHLEREGYKHFAILKGVNGDRVYIADPSRGNIRMSVYCFAEEWSGTALVLGKKGLGVPQSYPLALKDRQLDQNEMQNARRSLFAK